MIEREREERESVDILCVLFLKLKGNPYIRSKEIYISIYTYIYIIA